MRAPESAFAGLLLGTAAGDSVGLPREGLGRRRAQRLFGPGPLRQRLVLGRGLTSDDTEHTCLLAQALLTAGGAPAAFERALAMRLRLWLLTLPAGIGFGTLRALLLLWLLWSPRWSGVRSAGNGPAMRTALLGLVARDEDHLRELVTAATRLTHTDPRAEDGARLVALATRLGRDPEQRRRPAALLERLESACTTAAMAERIAAVRDVLAGQSSREELFETYGWSDGVSGFVLDTVPAALLIALEHPESFRDAVEAMIHAGGDTDTTAAIVGAMSGAWLGDEAIPPEWLDRLAEWPRSVSWMRRLAAALARAAPLSPETAPGPGAIPLLWPVLPLRSLVLMIIIIAHGLRRLLPPW